MMPLIPVVSGRAAFGPGPGPSSRRRSTGWRHLAQAGMVRM